MSFNVQCPECQKELRLRDEHAGKKIKCPECGHRFVAAAESDSIAMADEEERPRRKKQTKRRSDDDDRSRDVQQAPTPMEPMIWSVIALMLPCGPIGFAISGLAFRKVQTAMAELPAGKRSATARRNLQDRRGALHDWVRAQPGSFNCGRGAENHG